MWAPPATPCLALPACLLALQGELFSTAYFDGLAAEVDDNLQEAGVMSGADQCHDCAHLAPRLRA